MTTKIPDVLTAQQLANALGKNVDTIRKHAKAGKIKGTQDKNGKWEFKVADFPELFNAQVNIPAPAPKQSVERRLTDVIFVVDRSGSMYSLITKARQNLADQINSFRKDADAENQYRISVINFDDRIERTLTGFDVTALGTSTDHLYQGSRGGTKLYDAVLDAAQLAKTLDTKLPNHSFLISVITDGEENSSSNHVGNVQAQVAELNKTDRYTFVFAGPRGSRQVGFNMGFGHGNCTEWEQTYEGIATLGRTTQTSLNSYTTMRRRGIASATSFYANPITKDAASFANKLDDKLDDVSNDVKVERVTAADPVVINKFCEKKFGSFPKGQIYYQLTESEKVQDYKKLIIQDTATGNFYAGENAAKKLLGIPSFQGTVHIKPGSLGEFKVFVQSTSNNRKLTPGTAVIYLP